MPSLKRLYKMNAVYTQVVQILALQQLQEQSSFCIIFMTLLHHLCVVQGEYNVHNEIGVILLQSKTNYSLEWIVK